MSSFLILALASSALAVPFVGEGVHARQHRHHHHFFSSGLVGATGTGAGAPYPTATGSGAPYPIVNGTGFYPYTAGTAASTDSAVPTSLDSANEAAAVASSVSTSCSQSTTYVTETNRVTVTVHQSSSATSSADAASLEKKDRKQRWRKSTTVSSSTAVVETSAVASSTSDSISVASTSSSVVASSTTSSSASSQSSSSSSSGSGKRGVAYNDASLTTPFESSSEVTWGYNWGQSSSGLSSSFNYVPLLWGSSSTFTNGWAATVADAASNGVTHLMSFNEPDLDTQSNMTPEEAAAAYKTYMQPYAGQFKLGAPAVTNGGGAMGLNWLDAFITACDGCTIDFVAAHWYDSPSNTAYFEEHIANVSSVAGGLPVWLTEFGVTSGSDSDISTFLETVMPWMDSQDYVERYAYFMVSDGLLVSGGETSSYGSTYASYTGSS